MLRRHVNVEDVPFENVPTYDWLVDRNGNLLPRSHLWHIFPLVLDSQDYADPLSAAIDNWIFRSDCSFEHFNSDNCRIVSAKDEPFENFHLPRPEQELHLRLNAGAPLTLNPSRLVFENPIDYVSSEYWYPRFFDLFFSVRQQLDVESENHGKVGVFCSNGLSLDYVSPRYFAHVCETDGYFGNRKGRCESL